MKRPYSHQQQNIKFGEAARKESWWNVSYPFFMFERYSLSRSLSHTLSLSLALSHTHSLSLALSHTHTLSLASERRASTSTSSCRVPHLNQEIGFSIFFSIQRRRVSRSNVKLANGEEKKFFSFSFKILTPFRKMAAESSPRRGRWSNSQYWISLFIKILNIFVVELQTCLTIDVSTLKQPYFWA